MAEIPQYLSISEACKILKVSRPTFNKIRKAADLKELYIGKRPRFLREEIEGIAAPKPVSRIKPDKRISLDIFSNSTVFDIETSANKFDLTLLKRFDPQGVLNLFCTLVDRGRQGHPVSLRVEDNFPCNHLKSLGFFNQLEEAIPGFVNWDRERLRTDHTDFKYPIGLTKISLPKQEVTVVERLLTLLRAQGFSESIGGYIAWIFGELADNANTHLRIGKDLDGNTDSYLLAQRFKFSKSNRDCLIIGVADIGPGIHATIKRNPKHAELTDLHAFLSAFKPGVSSWPDEHKRGHGLTDILGIALGNRSIIHAESGGHSFEANLERADWKTSFDVRKPQGTRFSLVVIDHEFEMKSRDDVRNYIDERLKQT